jgi:Ni/Co efflux regulator RcnB
MKRLLLAASIAFALSPALAFAAPSPAPQPQPQHWSQDHGRGHGGHDRDKRNDRHDRDRGNYRGGNDRGRYRYDRRPVVVVQHDRRPVIVRHDNGRHLGWYKRGGRVPVVYLQPRYYVNDYRDYGLAPPPYGYRWVRPYGDDRYLLVQVATGLIMQVLGY